MKNNTKKEIKYFECKGCGAVVKEIVKAGAL